MNKFLNRKGEIFMNRRMTALLAAVMIAFTACASESNSDSAEMEEASSQSQPEIIETTEETVEEKEAQEEQDLNKRAVAFSQVSGVYAEPFTLELSCEENGDIYYTADGSDPTFSDTRIKYESGIEIKDRSGGESVVSAVDPVLISGNFCKYDKSSGSFISDVSAPSDEKVDKCTVIRAAAETDQGFSEICSQTYFIGTAEEHIPGIAESCRAQGTDLAVVSISMSYDDLFDSEKGIYVKGNIFDRALEEHLAAGGRTDGETARSLDANYKQRGRDWERVCNIDFLELSADGASEAFSQTCGIRIQGNYSRSDWQKGFRLYARNEYGKKKFSYPVFGEELKNDSGETIDKFKTLELRAGGNCAFTSKFNDIYWQDMSASLNCDTKASRPCVVYLNGEYWGVYVLEEDYSEDYFESHHGVSKDDVVVYKGDAETYSTGWKLDEGTLPDGVTDEGYYFEELYRFFNEHKDLQSQEDYDAFEKLVDIDSVRDYFLAEVWINNKWDWPGKNWSMWKTASIDSSNEYADGRWRFLFYDMEFGGVSGGGDASVNTVKEDNYKPKGLLDFDTNNPAVLCYAYLMTNENFRRDYCEKLEGLSSGIYEKQAALEKLDSYTDQYSPLFEQFFERYPGSGSTDNAINGGYASVQCIRKFLDKREDYITFITDWINRQF